MLRAPKDSIVRQNPVLLSKSSAEPPGGTRIRTRYAKTRGALRRPPYMTFTIKDEGKKTTQINEQTV